MKPHHQIMKKIPFLLLLAAILTLANISVFKAVAQSSKLPVPFSDLVPGQKYYDDIIELYNKGLVEGYEDDTFRPEQLISRAEFVKFTLGAGECVDCRYPPANLKSQYTQSPFPDISTDAWYFYCISRGKDQGIVTGYLGREKSGLFVPEDAISRAESIAILLRATGNLPQNDDPLILKDVDQSAWYAGYLKKAVNMKLIDYHNGFVAPEEKIQRGEFAHLVNMVIRSQQCTAVQKDLSGSQNNNASLNNSNTSGSSSNNSDNPSVNSGTNTNERETNNNLNESGPTNNRNGNNPQNGNGNENRNLSDNNNGKPNQNRNQNGGSSTGNNNSGPRINGNKNNNPDGGNANLNGNLNTNNTGTNANSNGSNNQNTNDNNSTKPDRDQDSVPDDSDACPDLPGDLKNAQNKNGCPGVGENPATDTKPGITIVPPACNMCPCASVDFKADIRPGDIVFSIISDQINQRIYTRSNLHYTTQ